MNFLEKYQEEEVQCDHWDWQHQVIELPEGVTAGKKVIEFLRSLQKENVNKILGALVELPETDTWEHYSTNYQRFNKLKSMIPADHKVECYFFEYPGPIKMVSNTYITIVDGK